MQEIIICAATKYKDKVWYGHRHRNSYDAMWSELSYNMSRKQFTDNGGERQHIEGFVTSTGRFVDRVEAYKIHKETVGTSFCGSYRGGELYSEDLY